MIPFLFIALTVPGFVLAVRALPPVERLVFAGVKPWACDICSCFWSTVIWALIACPAFGYEALAAAPPAYTVSLAVLGFLSRPTTAPPPLGDPPPSEDA